MVSLFCLVAGKPRKAAWRAPLRTETHGAGWIQHWWSRQHSMKMLLWPATAVLMMFLPGYFSAGCWSYCLWCHCACPFKADCFHAPSTLINPDMFTAHSSLYRDAYTRSHSNNETDVKLPITSDIIAILFVIVQSIHLLLDFILFQPILSQSLLTSTAYMHLNCHNSYVLLLPSICFFYLLQVHAHDYLYVQGLFATGRGS